MDSREHTFHARRPRTTRWGSSAQGLARAEWLTGRAKAATTFRSWRLAAARGSQDFETPLAFSKISPLRFTSARARPCAELPSGASRTIAGVIRQRIANRGSWPSVKITEEEVRQGLRRARYITTPRVETAVFVASRSREAAARRRSGRRGQDRARRRCSPRCSRRTSFACSATRGSTKLARSTSGTTRSSSSACRPTARSRRTLRGKTLSKDIFSREYLLERPLLRAITAPRRVVLLIDEVDKSDEEFEAFLLEVLSDFQVSVPELGTIAARHRPVVVLTSNCTRELSEALKRRCLHLYVEFPGAEKEAEILALKVPEADEALREQVARFVAPAAQARPQEGAVDRRDPRLVPRAAGARRARPRRRAPCGRR